MVAKIGPERGLIVVFRYQLQPKDTLCEIDRRRQIARTEAHITQLLDLDHLRASYWIFQFTFTLGQARNMSTGWRSLNGPGFNGPGRNSLLARLIGRESRSRRLQRLLGQCLL